MAPPVQPSIHPQLPNSSISSPIAPSVAAVERAALPSIKASSSPSAVSLLGLPAGFDYTGQLTEAKAALSVNNFQQTRQLCNELLVKAQALDCPYRFMKGSIFYVECLVCYAEASEDPNERLVQTTSAITEIWILAPMPRDVQTSTTLLGFLNRIEKFIQSPKDKSRFQQSQDGLLSKIQAFSELSLQSKR